MDESKPVGEVLDLKTAQRIAKAHGAPLALVRQVARTVMDEVIMDLRIGAAALGEASPSLGVAARTLIVRLQWAQYRMTPTLTKLDREPPDPA